MNRTLRNVIAAALVAAHSLAFSAGYEKAILWSGKHAGYGGAGTANAEGSESLYFNPAGLARTQGCDLNVNLSPTYIGFHAPPAPGLPAQDSKHEVLPVAAALVSCEAAPGFGVGAGIYVAGGNRATYENVDATPLNAAFDTLSPTVKADLEVVEASLGVGYELFSGFRVGAAWRTAFVNASLSSLANTAGVGATAIELTDLTDQRINGFRLGAQYSPDPSVWGVGVSWRTPLDFIARGKAGGRFESAAGGDAVELVPGEASVASSLPSQVAIGGYYTILPEKLRWLLDYTWSEYARDRELNIVGSVSFPTALGGTTVPLQAIPLAWMNMHNVKTGFEYAIDQDWAARIGYVWISQVTPKGNALATISAPGTAHAVTLGGGHVLLDRKLSLDAALEYNWGAGDVTNEGAAPGHYSAYAWVLHMGATYRF